MSLMTLNLQVLSSSFFSSFYLLMKMDSMSDVVSHCLDWLIAFLWPLTCCSGHYLSCELGVRSKDLIRFRCVTLGSKMIMATIPHAAFCPVILVVLSFFLQQILQEEIVGTVFSFLFLFLFCFKPSQKHLQEQNRKP